LIGAPPSELKKWKEALTDTKDWRTVRDGLEVKLCKGPDGAETFVLCRSAQRQKKEKAMHERFAQHIERGLASLGRRIEKSKKALERGPIERQIGRLLGVNPRAAGRYSVTLHDAPEAAAKLRLDWSVRSDWEDWARLHEGCYVLRTNVNDWTPEELWRTYTQLSEAEAAFRIHKSDLSLRPIWHQKQSRVQAHIFVCFLAYALWKTLEQWQKRAELGNSPRTVLEEIGRIQSTDVVLPLASDPTRELRIRCVVRPDMMQAALLDRLGLRLPERLRLPVDSLAV
jgi:transposase